MQAAILTHQGFRIDQQLNGPVKGGNTGDMYLQLAVQAGSNLYAAVMVPVLRNTDGRLVATVVPAGGIRKALFESLERGETIAFTRSARKSWLWALALANFVALIAV